MKLQDALTKDEEREMFAALRACEPGSDEHLRILSLITERNLKLVRKTVYEHFRKCPEFLSHVDDVESHFFAKLPRIATAFDPTRGFRFSTYLVAAIKREIKWITRKSASTVYVPWEAREYLQFASITFDLVDDTEAAPDESADMASWCERKAGELLSMLPIREREILRCRYGIGRDKMTYQSIAEAQGVTAQCVRNIHLRAIRRLQTTARPEMAS